MIEDLRYYIIPSDNIEEYKPLMIESLNTQNIYIRMSLDDTKGIMVFSDSLAPQGVTPYTKEEMLVIVSGPEWTTIEE